MNATSCISCSNVSLRSPSSAVLTFSITSGAGLAFLTHGEDRQVTNLAQAIRDRSSAETVDPSYGDRIRI